MTIQDSSAVRSPPLEGRASQEVALMSHSDPFHTLDLKVLQDSTFFLGNDEFPAHSRA